MLQLLAATTNKNKIREFQEMFSEITDKVTIVSPDIMGGLPDIIEDGATFEENSAIKAKEASRYADMSAFADDSGLEVDALTGEPGINSARYAGPDATDADRIAKLLKNMEGKTNRKARFVCVISLAYRGNLAAQFRGEVEGTITDAPRGENGFGYDPIFQPDGFDKSFAELTQEEKNRISHRADAYRKALEFVEDEMSILDDEF